MALSHRGRVAKKQLRRQVASQFGTRRPIDRRELARVMQGKAGRDIDTQIAMQANPKIQKMFYPKRGARYPLDQVGHEFSKMPGETIHNFVPMQQILPEITRVPQIASLIAHNPFLSSKLTKVVKMAIRERGIKSSKFWEIADKGYIDRIAAAGKGKLNEMNQLTGRKIAEAFGAEIKPRTILDLGSFAGGTVKEVVLALNPKQRKLLKVILVDVAGDIVRKHAVPELRALGVPAENIKVIPVSFYKAAVSYKFMPKPLHEKGERGFSQEFLKLIGEVDAVTAGAATINFATDLKPYLKSIKKMLKPGGIFVNWDWGSAEVREPSVNVPALKRAVIGEIEGRKITHYDAYVSFLNFWMRSYGYPPNVVDKMIADINASKRFDFTGWVERNLDWIEKERSEVVWTDKKTGQKRVGRPGLQKPFGYRNRAYRMGSAMQNEAKRTGLKTSRISYPLGKPGQLDTGNLNWMLVMRK